mmetsp:Transcript_27744/g.55830  ORF Transcript_27744/g.55830 Transcript_27744/m.55830 type:complete len:239 (-) Transcript_27744:3554-4270(-)
MLLKRVTRIGHAMRMSVYSTPIWRVPSSTVTRRTSISRLAAAVTSLSCTAFGCRPMKSSAKSASLTSRCPTSYGACRQTANDLPKRWLRKASALATTATLARSCSPATDAHQATTQAASPRTQCQRHRLSSAAQPLSWPSLLRRTNSGSKPVTTPFRAALQKVVRPSCQTSSAHTLPGLMMGQIPLQHCPARWPQVRPQTATLRRRPTAFCWRARTLSTVSSRLKVCLAQRAMSTCLN